MRIRLFMDPDVIEDHLVTGDYPSVRQILDELYSSGNADLGLFSTEGLQYIEQFIEENNLDTLIRYRVDSSERDITLDADIIADVRPELLEVTTASIDITDGYEPLVRWFCPNSKLLDDEWCLINSSDFIDDVDTALNDLDDDQYITSVDGTEVKASYLEVEKIFVFLHRLLKSDEEHMHEVRLGDFSATRTDEGVYFNYEG